MLKILPIAALVALSIIPIASAGKSVRTDHGSREIEGWKGHVDASLRKHIEELQVRSTANVATP